MEYREKQPLPQICLDCPERKEAECQGLGADACCYNCEYALDRFEITNIQ